MNASPDVPVTQHRSAKTDPPPPDYETNMRFDEVIEKLEENNRLVQQLCRGLLDKGGELDKLGKTMRDNLDTHRSEMTAALGALADKVTDALLRIGLIETRDSEPRIVADIPFTCLVVDDQADVRRTIRRVLEQAGINVFESPGGEDALHMLKGDAPIDVVLTDLNMPGNGTGLVAHVREDHPRVELVIMTAYEGRAASEALEKGAHSYLTKPFRSNDDLVLSVIRAAQHRRARSARNPRG